jgi:hypothetical protein
MGWDCQVSGRLFRIGGELAGFVGASPEPEADTVFDALLVA